MPHHTRFIIAKIYPGVHWNPGRIDGSSFDAIADSMLGLFEFQDGGYANKLYPIPRPEHTIASVSEARYPPTVYTVFGPLRRRF
jgi:hypothetical protein